MRGVGRQGLKEKEGVGGWGQGETSFEDRYGRPLLPSV